jgi:ribonuclease PH
MNNQWQKKAKQAQKETDAEMAIQIVQLSSIKQKEIDLLLAENKMDRAEFNQLIKLIKDQTKSNNDKIKALSNMQNGLELLVGLVGKLI